MSQPLVRFPDLHELGMRLGRFLARHPFLTVLNASLQPFCDNVVTPEEAVRSISYALVHCHLSLPEHESRALATQHGTVLPELLKAVIFDRDSQSHPPSEIYEFRGQVLKRLLFIFPTLL